MIKALYRNRAELLVKEYISFKEYSEQVKMSLEELEKDALVYKEDIKNITLNTNIRPSEKYELINAKLEDIEKIALKISSVYNTINDKFNGLNKERDILIKTCIEDNTDLTEDIIIKELAKMIEEGK